MILADCGYFVALLDPDDGLHSRAIRWSRRLSEPVLVSEYVLVEAFSFFSAPRNRFRPHGLLAQLQSDETFEIVYDSSEWFQKGVAFHKARPDKEWSLTDCISFLLMQERGVTRALAFDHHFEQAGFEALLRREP